MIYLTIPDKCPIQMDNYLNNLIVIESKTIHPILKNYLKRSVEFINNQKYDLAVSCLSLATAYYE